jgi:hypothetical protein
MAGKLYVDEIRDVATTGAPSFPNGLDVTNLIDPVGAEGDVLTVQADGTILAAAASGGSGIPITVSGITDLSDAAEIALAIMSAMPPLAYTGQVQIQIFISDTTCTEQIGISIYDDGGVAYAFDDGTWTASGAGSVLVWGIRWAGL